jgi:hypothetical protein
MAKIVFFGRSDGGHDYLNKGFSTYTKVDMDFRYMLNRFPCELYV